MSADLTLVIGDKHLSSWSLRPWLALKEAGIAFREETIRLDRPDTRAQLQAQAPAGQVPFLRDGDLTIWDSLAILEYIADRFPDKRLWPDDPRARAVARSVSAEMHSGFSKLRTLWPMQFARDGLAHLQVGLDRDIARIDAIWTTCRKTYGAGGPFLFGAFSIADAMYAPIASRFRTYGPVALSAAAAAYRDHVLDGTACVAWRRGAEEEYAGTG
ncbi:MAG: glutathione S-transferase family protein [Pseudomonadota bacterium]